MFGLLNNYYTFTSWKSRASIMARCLSFKYDIERLLLVDYRKMDGYSVKCLLNCVNLLKDKGRPGNDRGNYPAVSAVGAGGF